MTAQPSILPKKGAYLHFVIFKNPSEIFRVIGIALATAKLRYMKRCIGKGSIVGLGCTIVNSANVKMGEHVLLQDAIYIRAGIQGRVTLGDRTAINSFVRMFGHGSIEIGDDTQIGPGSLITTTFHDYRKGLETDFSGVVIGKGAWIGANVTILAGVAIGDGAVIGAGSVVNKSIPARAIAVGIPAKVVKMIDEEESAYAISEVLREVA